MKQSSPKRMAEVVKMRVKANESKTVLAPVLEINDHTKGLRFSTTKDNLQAIVDNVSLNHCYYELMM
jgi:hypothetical protein